MTPKQNGNILKILKRIHVFDKLSPTQLQKLLSICNSRTLQDGEMLFKRGDPSDGVFILLRGSISLLREDGIDEDNVRAFEHEEVCSKLLRMERELGLAYESMSDKGLDASEVRGGVEEKLRGEQHTVLIVDDESEICDFLSRALAEYNIITAEDGVDPLQAAVKEEAVANLGFDDFVFKPMRVAQLRSTVKSHLAKIA
jgi:hypothetical protein